jgi:hypothetical protein
MVPLPEATIMPITLSLSTGAEKRLRAVAEARGRTIEDIVREMLELHYGDQPCDKLTPEERVAAWRDYVAKHAVHGVVVDDSREGIDMDEE